MDTAIEMSGERPESTRSYDRIRWQPGERLHHLFERRCDTLRAEGDGDRLAVQTAEVAITFDELDARANRLARHLLAQGARPGDRIGLLFDDAVPAYAAMLAVSKINAAYVPLDVGFPPDRLAYITEDAGVRLVLTQAHLRDRIDHLDAATLPVDTGRVVDELPASRLSEAETGPPVDELCYVIYTSGTTGRPKGVAIEHASICNFVLVAAEVYGFLGDDRVYQGMTIAFDFSVEETWVPLLAGATLVPKPSGTTLLGHDLWEFLRDNRITALCCVPTLLATLDEDLPDLRFLLVSGEACPRDLVVRWHRPGRRFLNVYGPTEATVTATWTVLHPDRPVTIGVPLPTYRVVILDPDADRIVNHGESGEIGIAGIGLADGYLNRPDLTERAFIPDFLGLDGNPSRRIYRTGDLGRINENGEIEYGGRIDTQVKIRGYRIELTEIESVLLQVKEIALAVVDTFEPAPGAVELVAYYTLRPGTTALDHERVYALLRDRLPSYMVPAYLEELPVIPVLPSGKADRKNLPAPSGPRNRADRNYRAPVTDTERTLADLLGEVLGVPKVSRDHHFFDDLGANSLLMARFCALVRNRTDLPAPAMRDVYQHPTIETLAGVLTETAPEPVPEPTEPAPKVGTLGYLLCGTIQALIFLGYLYLIAVAEVAGYTWVDAAAGPVGDYLRLAGLSGMTFAGLCVVPIAAKWVLIGRWKVERIPIWSLRYVRFWTVRMLLRFNPLALFTGSPLYPMYLRALGARIGRGAVLLSQNMPVCADLLTIGEGAVVRKDSFVTCYRAGNGVIETGRLTIGAHAVVGEATVLDIDTALGDGAQLAHSSSLRSGQVVPEGERWHGCPARPSMMDPIAIEPRTIRRGRRFLYCVLQLANLLLIAVPLLFGLLQFLGDSALSLAGSLTGWVFLGEQLGWSAAVLVGLIVAGLLLVTTGPRLLRLLIRPGRVYPLYGARYTAHRLIARVTNLKTFQTLFGDSSYITGYLRALGYDLSTVEQTGSNFGLAVKHETPYLSTVGTGTMVSDGLSLINADFSDTSFTVARTTVGERNFLGNNIAYPAGARTGDNCLLATKVLVPLDGPVREGVGLLGSPPFEIPRSVQRDGAFEELRRGPELRRRLRAKLRHNTGTIALYLAVRCGYLFGTSVLFEITDAAQHRFGAPAFAVAEIAEILFTLAVFILVERASTGFRRLRPRFCSIYDRKYWRHERFWKLSAGALVQLFNGTPVKPVIWRLLGVRMGGRVFDDGCGIPEKTLVRIGSGTALNTGSVIQCHSLEDGTFKSDRTTVGAGCTLRTGAFVHYGVTIGDGATVGTDSFLMKGTEVPPGTHWQGNPAREVG